MTKILIVEDNDITAKAIRNTLDKGGYDVEEASNGKEALELIDRKDFDLIIVDLMLPYVNGLELIQKVRMDVSKRDVKIIAISSIDSEPVIAEAFKQGADDYIIKPIIAAELLTRVSRFAMAH